MMRDEDVRTFWAWLRYLWREERSWLVQFSIVAVLWATCIGLLTFSLLTLLH
jgi:hypothetical protein